MNDGGDNSRFAIAKTKKIVYCYDLNGNFITEYESLSEAERQTGISNSNISRAIRTGGRTQQYIWSYEKLPALTKYKRKIGKLPDKTKKVGQFSMDGILSQTYNSLKEAKENTGISDASISQVCHEKRKSAGGFLWKFI